MFKSILPSRRVPSADFQMLTNPPFSEPNGKENCYPHLTRAANERYRTEKQKNSKGKDMPMEGIVTTEAFDRLLVSLAFYEVHYALAITFVWCFSRIYPLVAFGLRIGVMHQCPFLYYIVSNSLLADVACVVDVVR